MIDGFRKFLLRGNVIDLAVAVVIGAAFTGIVTAIVEGLVTPLIGAFGGIPDFSAWTFTINNSQFQIGRVINASGRERYSIPVFFGVRPDVKLECLPTCHGPGNPPRYAPVSYSDHMRLIRETNYQLPDRGEKQ